ncbi:MAG: hypothetical protein J2P25_26590 [Nocardiopsaceae bacterium]|nr:hypothetical protein [Nocardiopsaceae bacterium]
MDEDESVTPGAFLFDPERGTVIREAPGSARGYWAGAPAIYRDPGSGEFYLTYRCRRDRGDEPDRGYAGYIARSGDGMHFEDVWSITKDQLGSPSMERFGLCRDGDRWLLYISYVDPADNRWRIDVLTADGPGAFRPDRRVPVLTAAATGTEGVKDPHVRRSGRTWLMFASYAARTELTPEQRAAAHSTADIYTTGATTHPTGLATSLDGLTWQWHGQVLGVGGGWDRYASRITTVVRDGDGWLGLYDGAVDKKQNCEEQGGVALSFDLVNWVRLTPDRPAFTSGAATGSLRYIDCADAGEDRIFYYEHARADGAHDLRAIRVAREEGAP